MSPHRIFVGWDPRQIVSYTVLCQSIIDHASEPVSITPLVLETLPIKRQGLTPFTYSRFLVPYLCNWQGKALFLDVDILLRDDVTKLFRLQTPGCAVNARLEPLKFERASVMLFDCGHYANRRLTPEYIEIADKLHTLGWIEHPQYVGDLPDEWNTLAEYDEPNPDAKLFHYTSGVPCHAETDDLPFADEWRNVAAKAVSTETWFELMARSVHAKPVYDRLVAQGKIKPREPVDAA